MKKTLLTLAACLALMAFSSGCASTFPVGVIFTELKLPIAVTSNEGRKVGRATCRSVMGLVTWGDASIATAMKNGKITEISHIDWEVKNILGFFGEYTIVVYGD